MPVEIVPVHGRLALARFIGLPWRLIDRRAYPQWVPPLRAAVADAVDQNGNPFYQDAERELADSIYWLGDAASAIRLLDDYLAISSSRSRRGRSWET
ncbi:MAG: hypothetical protein EXR95_02990 [Gemmatimonadetes bacterium]|nr:hypothetical protein [Gemmatimonadota bacterium]